MQDSLKNRRIPFGYQFINGIIETDDKTAEIVVDIFNQYINGKSLLAIAEILNKYHVEYLPGKEGWNKSRIKRVIEDRRYLGEYQFPQIISNDIFEKAEQIKASRNNQNEVDRQSEIYKLRVPVKCPRCESQMKRYCDNRANIKQRWKCKNTNCGIIIAVSDERLINEVRVIIKYLADHPDYISVTYSDPEINTEEIKTDNQINNSLNMREFDQQKIKELIYQRVSLQYDSLDNQPFISARIRDILQSQFKLKPQDLPMPIIQKIIDNILVDENGQVSLVLRNGQKIRKEDVYATRKKES